MLACPKCRTPARPEHAHCTSCGYRLRLGGKTSEPPPPTARVGSPAAPYKGIPAVVRGTRTLAHFSFDISAVVEARAAERRGAAEPAQVERARQEAKAPEPHELPGAPARAPAAVHDVPGRAARAPAEPPP